MLQTTPALINAETDRQKVTKYCWKCQTTKNTNDFYKNRSKKDGLQDICKACNHNTCKNYYKSHPDKVTAKHQRIKDRNISRMQEGLLPKPQKLCFRCKQEKPSTEFYKCISRFDGLQSACKQCNRELDKERYKSNPSAKNTSTKKWRINNPLAVVAMKANRRARESQAEGKFTKRDVENLYNSQNARCACCGVHLNNVFQVDHIIPLSRGGTNYPTNLQLLRPSCNQSKNSKTMAEYMETKSGGKS